MTGTDVLRDLFEERTADVQDRPERTTEVSRRVRRTRRRRAVSAVAALAVGVAGTVGLLAPGGAPRSAPPVPALQQKVDGLPVWTNGSRLAAHTTFLAPERRSATFPVTPSSWSLGVSELCSRDLGESLGVYWAVNGRVYGGGTCGSGGGDFARGAYGLEERYWREAGVQLGEPMTVRVWVAQTERGSHPFAAGGPPVYTGPMPETRVAFGLYERVDPSAYPLPPRPATLQSLDDGPLMAGGPVLRTMDSRRVGANATVSATLRLPADGLTYSAQLVSPGQLVVAVNGTTVDRIESWGYDSAGAGGIEITPKEMRQHGVVVQPGQDVTVTVTASRFTDPGWLFLLRRGTGG